MIQGGDPTGMMLPEEDLLTPIGTGRGGESIWGRKFQDELVPILKVLNSRR